MKKIIKNYILLYNQRNFVKDLGWQVTQVGQSEARICGRCGENSRIPVFWN